MEVRVIAAHTTVHFTEPDQEVTLFSFVTSKRTRLHVFDLGDTSIQMSHQNLAKLAAACAEALTCEDAACE